MESTLGLEIDLFAEELPSLEQIRTLSGQIHASEAATLGFAAQVEDRSNKTGGQALIAVGIGLSLLGRFEDAEKKLAKGNDCVQKYVCLGFCQRWLGKTTEAIASLDKSREFGADPLTTTLEKAATYRQAGDLEATQKELAGCANFENVSAEYHYQLGRLLEVQGLYVEAAANYRTALELAPDHSNALFHLAYRCDLSGDEEAAMDYYRQIISNSPAYVSALLNLTVLYEDAAQYEKATACVTKVLESHPNHPRARLFAKDIDSSKTMFYDEEREKRRSRKNQILETPISDFELSVRSRNCLRKMNIRTLGDLLNISEAELLSYKNFGETSLREIKAILDTKGLRLGMALEEPQFQPEEPDHVSPEEQGLLTKPVDDLQLSVRARKCLQKLNLHTLGDLTRTTEAELLGCKNFGVTSLNEIKKAMGGLGLSLRSLD